MKLLQGDDLPFAPADPKNFVGSARVKKLPMVEDGGQSVIVYLVEFEAGGRTNWHRHSAPQLLLVKEGRGLVQKWGEPVRAIAAGDAVCIEPDEKHWHGAAPGTRMSHFAVNLTLTTQWLEPVSDDQYRAS
jgi:quercetin dioxygenase-like cupin family protein